MNSYMKVWQVILLICAFSILKDILVWVFGRIKIK